jgi:predicted Fe-S protein YdhL (DUF1289 family)
MDDSTGLCEGCWRSIDEIAQWSNADEQSKRAILSSIEQRRKLGKS